MALLGQEMGGGALGPRGAAVQEQAGEGAACADLVERVRAGAAKAGWAGGRREGLEGAEGAAAGVVVVRAGGPLGQGRSS